MKEKKSDKCEFCGGNLVYATDPKNHRNLTCMFCEESFTTNIYCEKGHYICDNCHSKNPIEIIERICEETNIKDPFKLADLIMKHHKFKVYGPEHHVLTPAVILTALKNNDIKKVNGDDITPFDIKEGIRRASKIPGGWCGFYDSCGAGMGFGIAVSIMTGATPSTNTQRSLANEMTSKSLAKIADNLEHCCKRSVKLAICETLDFLKEKFNIEMNYEHNKCNFSEINDKCEKGKCPFF
ncbi:MAG: SAM-dependent methyltransferase [Candidatus Lokiarchaeota archaeon]|nr:SAM-dependent methyltransferase [Candidatus Lokiarchaeota archaeon]